MQSQLAKQVQRSTPKATGYSGVGVYVRRARICSVCMRNSQREALEAMFRLESTLPDEPNRNSKQTYTTTFAAPPVDWSLFYIQESMLAALQLH